MTISSKTYTTTNRVQAMNVRLSRSVEPYPGIWSGTNSMPVISLGQTSRTVWRDSDYRLKIAKLKDASLPYLSSGYSGVVPYLLVHSGSRKSGVAPAISKREHVLRQMSVASYSKIGPTTDPALYDLALGRFKKKLSDKVGGADAFIPLVEMRELGKTIRASSTWAVDLVTSLARFRKTKGKSLYRYFEDQWLNFSFGVSPIIGDTMAILDSLNNYFDRPTTLHRIRAGAQKSWTTGDIRKVEDSTFDGWGFRTSATLSHTLTYHFTAGIDFSLICGNDYSLREHLGLSDLGSQLPSLGWELFPYSWVLDYFTTMGAYLEDTFVLPPGSTKYLSVSQLYKCVAVEVPEVYPITTGMRFAHTPYQYMTRPGYWDFHYFTRTPLSSLPHQSLRIKSVDEVGLNAVNKLLNLVALIKPR